MLIRLLRLTLVLVLPLAAHVSRAQTSEHSHTPGVAPATGKSGEASHHARLELERAALERGEGFGMALAADRNGYPGPKHVLDLRSELRLTPEQRAGMEKLYAQMHEHAVALGKEVLAAEKSLETMFAENRSEAELREQAYRVATLRADLRWAHLSAHLASRKLLNGQQVALYSRLRRGPH